MPRSFAASALLAVAFFSSFSKLVCSTSVAPPPPPPPPPPMTPTQIAAMGRLSSAAQAAAQFALNTTLQMLADEVFVEELTRKLGGAAGVAALNLNISNPFDIWKRYSAELKVAEIAHAFPAAYNPNQNNALDLDVGMALNASWFYNQWQLPILFPHREAAATKEFIMFLAPSAATEVLLWGLEKFSASIPEIFGPNTLWPGGYPANLSEASNRAVYGMLNQQKLDDPGFYWGDTIVVFNNSAVSEMTILQPIDTGDYVSDCDSNFTHDFCSAFANNATYCKYVWFCEYVPTNGSCLSRPSTPAKNCSSWRYNHAVGTFDNNAHLMPAYATFEKDSDWRDRLSDLLARMLPNEATPLSSVQNMTIPNFDFYYEANLLGNPNFNDGYVKFVVASLPALFGDLEWGAKVQQWCIQRGWTLLWSLGPNPNPGDKHKFPSSWEANKRVFDPIVLGNSSAAWNISQSRLSSAVSLFDSVWEQAAQARAAGLANVHDLAVEWWAALVHYSTGNLSWLATRPLSSDSCANPGRCIGTALTGSDPTDSRKHCVCYE